MGFRDSLQNVRYFFKWLAQVLNTWFLPYHSDEEEEGEASAQAESDNAPDRSPKPSPPPEEAAAAAESLPPAPTTTEPETAEATTATATPSLAQIMAFRGSLSKRALAAIARQDVSQVESDLEQLVQSGIAEDAGDDRCRLISTERRQLQRSDRKMSEWLARLENDQLENETLDILDELFRELALRVSVRRNLILHVRQKIWMTWQSQKELCRVRVFSRTTPEQWSRIRYLDKGARRFRPRGRSRPGMGGDQVTFGWRAGADVYEIEGVLREMGQEFQKQVRHYHKRRKSATTSPEAETTTEMQATEAETDLAVEEETDSVPPED